MREWRNKNIDRERERKRQWDRDHREEKLAYSKKHYLEHRTEELKRQKEYRDKGGEKLKIRVKDGRLRRKYNFSYSQFLDMAKKQKGKCLICGIDLVFGDKGKGHAMLDHSHKTGIVRGILCQECNHGLGQFRDDIDILKSAIKYLRGIL